MESNIKIRESEIRDKIAANLGLIDPHLTLVGKEYPVKIPYGTKAFIDILAKDSFGCYTIIEIKKSTQTSRNAVQQLYKYAGYLKIVRRLESHQIRCVIISTTWDDLSIPFGEYEHFSDYDSKGYELIIHKNGEYSLKEVIAKFEPGDTKPLQNFVFFEFLDITSRDRIKKDFEDILCLLPSLNCITINADYEGTGSNIVNAHGFAWVFFTGNMDAVEEEIARLPAQLQKNKRLFEQNNIDEDDETDSAESIIRQRILTEYVKIPRGSGEFSFYALHTLNNTLQQWLAPKPLGFGPMFSDDFYSSQEMIGMACGFMGAHPYNFVAYITPKRPQHFAMVRDRLDQFLIPNPRWRRAVNELLGGIDDDDRIQISIYNPLNFFGQLNDLFVDGSSKRIPSLTIRHEKYDGSICQYYGSLFWTSKKKPMSVSEAVTQSYPSFSFFVARSVFQILNAYDVALSDIYGLSYELINFSENGQKILRLDTVCYWEEITSIKTIQDFINANDSLIDEVGKYYSTFSV